MEFLKDPPILFFVLGILSVFLRTGLDIPSGLSKFLSLYLLMAIGFKGGGSLAKTGFSEEFIVCLIGGISLSVLVPVLLYFGLKRVVDKFNAAGIAATYGSVSAVTFIAATTWLENRGLDFQGSMIAILALMEAPAIIVSLFLVGRDSRGLPGFGLGKLLHESLLNGSVFLLLGSVLIGYVAAPFGPAGVETLLIDLFKGFLSFFLLDLGIKSGTSLMQSRLPKTLILTALIMPVLGASAALAWGVFWSVSPSQTFLLMTLGAGASYIAVPAALQLTLPKADAGIYLTMALGITFPFNILFGLPIYWKAVRYFIG